MPNFNSVAYLAQAIESVICQSFVDWELIIVDDFSNDGSRGIIKKYAAKDKRIRYIFLKKNSGAANARNIGIAVAKGRYIAFLDSDDIWEYDKLKLQKSFMEEKKNRPVSFTSYSLIDAQGNPTGKKISALEIVDLNTYLLNTIIGFSTSMIDKEKIDNIHFMNLSVAEDFQFWISILKKGFKAYGMQEQLVKYRVHGKSLSANKFRTAYQIWKIYYSIEKFGLIRSVYYFASYILNAIKKRL